MITSVTVRRFKSFGDVHTRPRLGRRLAWLAASQPLLQRRVPGGDRLQQSGLARVVWSRENHCFVELNRLDAATAVHCHPGAGMALLWQGRQTSGVEAPPGRKRRIEIILQGDDNGGWECGVEIEYGTPETVNVRPIGSLEGIDISTWPPRQAMDVGVVHIPPMSGISREEPRHDRGYQNLLIGQGRPGEVLRNLLYEVSQQAEDWTGLCEHIQTLFGFELLVPKYAESNPHIICEYRPEPKARPLDIANAGSGFLQVLLLFAFFYARPGSVLLLDEPDAHLHVILQKEMHDVLRRIAAERRSQLLIATHSEVLLDATSPERVISFVKTRPRRLADRSERDGLREAMKRLTTTELLMAEQTGAIIYLEDQSDERILSAWAAVLDHPARTFLDQPFVHPLRGNSVKEAKAHFFAFRSVIEPVSGLVILDGDDRDMPEDEDIGEGLRVVRWQRYEIENYLLVPRAIAAAGWGGDTLALEPVLKVFHREVPPGTDLFADVAGLSKIKASERFLPELLKAAGRDLAKRDFFLVAAQMQPPEVHPDVVAKLDLIAETLRPPTLTVEEPRASAPAS